jgi:pimeloyl-ACP methyl ester carboxylesterase
MAKNYRRLRAEASNSSRRGAAVGGSYQRAPTQLAACSAQAVWVLRLFDLTRCREANGAWTAISVFFRNGGRLILRVETFCLLLSIQYWDVERHLPDSKAKKRTHPCYKLLSAVSLPIPYKQRMRISRCLNAILLLSGICGRVTLRAQDNESASGLPSNADSTCSHPSAKCLQEWTGVRTSGRRSQALVLHFGVSGSGEKPTVDLPDFGALGIPAANFHIARDQIHFELVGDSSTAVFDGTLKGEAIEGHWKEGDRFGNFALKSSYRLAGAVRTETVSFQHGVVRLSGTPLIPQRAKPSPAIILVQGAGPETRSASQFLAQDFATHGVAALIYDKRGAGDSTGDWKHASFEELAGDVEAAIAFLKRHPEVNPHQIGLMGSSQGGWIAPMAAVHSPEVAFVIVKSAAAVTPEKQELARVEIQMRGKGYSQEEITEALHLYKHAIAYARSGEGWDALKREIDADSTKEWAFFGADTPSDFWFFDQIRLFFAHDPLPVLRDLNVPLLVIFGGKDELGPPLASQIGQLLAAMRASGKESQLEIFPNAGHDLRTVPDKAQSWDFGRFAPGYLPTLRSWVEAHTTN